MADADYLTQLTSGDKSPPPSINTGTDLNSVVSNINGKPMDTATYQKGLSEIQKKLDENIAERKKIPDATPPVMEPEPKPQQTDPMQTFGSAAMVLSTLGSLMTKHPLTSALNSAAALNNAVNQADAAASKDAFDKWKLHTENAMKMADWNLQNIKSMYEKNKDNHADLMSEMEVWSKMTQDPTLDRMAKVGDIKTHLALLEKTNNELKQSYDEQKLAHEKANSIIDDWKEKNGVTEDSAVPKKVFIDAQIQAKSDIKAADKGNAGGGEPTWSPEAINGAARYLATAGKFPANMGRLTKNDPNRTAIMNQAFAMNPDLDLAAAEADQAGRISEARKVGTMGGGIKLAANILDQSLPSMMDAAKKVGLSPSTDFNTLYNTAKRHMSNQDFANFSTQLRAVTSDYALMIGRGRMTVHSDDEALKILNDSMGITSLQGFVDAVQTEKKNILKGVEITQKKDEEKVSMLV